MKYHQFSVHPVYACIEQVSVDDDLCYEDEDMEGQWVITDFFSKDKKSGKARECMRKVFLAAREYGVKYIAIHPWARDGITQESLVKFYLRCGFIDAGYAFVKKV